MNQDPFFAYFIKNRESLSQQMHKEKSLFKRYSRFPQILLPAPEQISETFSDMVSARRSLREYADRPLTLQELSTFFFWSAGRLEKRNKEKDINERRVHPSGGGKFPLELYVLILKSGEIERGVYHYNIEMHALEQMITVDIDTTLAQLAPHDDFAREGGMIILFSFVKDRSVGKYGALAYKLAFMESGHISQNMYLLSSTLNLACCGMGMNDGSGFDKALQVDSIDESVFYGLAVGVKRENVL